MGCPDEGNATMRLDKYYKTLSMIKNDKSVDEIQKETGLQTDEILHMISGARIPPVIIFQFKDKHERCPGCGRKVLLPCLACTHKIHPNTCMDVIKRPEGHKDEPVDIALDYQLE